MPTSSRLRRGVAVLLSLAILAVCPGLAPYQAAAQQIRVAAPRGRAVPPVTVRVSALNARSLLSVSPAGSLLGTTNALRSAPLRAPAASAAAVSLPASAIVAASARASASQVPAALAAAARALSVPALAAREPGNGPASSAPRDVDSPSAAGSATPGSADAASAREQLDAAAAQLGASAPVARPDALTRFFDGARRVLGMAPAPRSSVSENGSSKKAAADSGSNAFASAAPATPAPASPDAGAQSESETPAAAPRPVGANPARIALEGPGLQPGERFLSGAPATGPPAPPKPPSDKKADDGLPESQQKRAIWGLTWNRLFSLMAGSISAIAYPLMVIEAVGQQAFYDLSGLGSLIGIPLALAAGAAGDSLRNRGLLKSYTIFNIGLRAAIGAVQAVFYVNGWLGFWPLLFLTVLSTWQFATLFSNDFALNAEIVGSDKNKMRSVEALIRMTTIGVTVVSGLFLGAAAIQALGLFWTFMLVAAIQLIPVFILQRMLPPLGKNGRDVGYGEALRAALRALDPRLWVAAARALAAALRKAASSASSPEKRRSRALAALALAAATAVFFIPIPGAPFLLKSPIPFVIVAGTMIWRSEASKIIRTNTLLRMSLLFVMIGAFIEVPLRNSVLGVLAAETTTSASAAATYLGSLVAAFYLGQLPSGTGMLDPKLTVKVGRLNVPFRKTMKWVGAAGVAAWAYFVLLPPGLIASAATALGLVPAVLIAALAAAVMGGYFALHAATPKISDTLWMKMEAGALLFMGFPLLFGLAPWSLFVALAAFGFVLNGSQRMVSATFSVVAKKAVPEKFQLISGMRGAFFNISTALAYTTYSLAKSIPEMWGQTNAFPFTWYVIAATYAVFAYLFWRGSSAFAEPKSAKPKP